MLLFVAIRSLKLIPSCSSISRLHPCAPLCIFLLPAYPSIGSHLFGKFHDDFLRLGGDVCTSLFSKIYDCSALRIRYCGFCFLLTVHHVITNMILISHYSCHYCLVQRY